MAHSKGGTLEVPVVPTAPPTLRKPKPVTESQPLLLLSKEENQCVFDILGPCRQSLSTALCQLLVPSLDESEWEKQETGVLCLIRDQIMKSYFIQVLSLRTKQSVFQQEIYNEFEYQMPLQFFLTFEGDERMFGINFADESEASRFREALENLLELRKQRLGDGLSQKNQRTSYYIAPSGPIAQLDSGSQSSQTTKILFQRSNTNGIKKGKLSKADIGTPMNYRHVQHVGFDPDKGFDLDGDLDTKLLAFLKKVGVSDQQFEDANTRDFIFKFIDQHGGLDAVKNEVIFKEENVNPSPLTAGTTNVDPANKTRPSIPSRPLPAASSPAQGSVGLLPPPPPPLLCLQEPAPPPSAPFRASQTNESEPNLRDSIASNGDERSNLMLQIQKGISLKKVVAEPVKEALTDTIGGLAGALARSLADRNKAMRLSDSDTSDSVEAHDLEDDEWD